MGLDKLVILVLISVCVSVKSVEEDKEWYYGTFPEGFLWASASSSHQVEGAYDEDGKSQNIWDTFCMTPGKIENNDTGFVACDSYHKLEEDVAMLVEMGVNSYRFSISWSRVLPDGETENPAGVDYYNRLIDALLAQNIEPMVTLYHWDLPQVLQDGGGFLDTEYFVNYFLIYSRFCFDTFGDRVKYWITFNEPWVIAYHGHEIGIYAPGIAEPGIANYQSAHTCIIAHAECWHLYNDTYRATQGGLISITLNGGYSIPLTDGETNVNASQRAMLFDWGWFAHPIFKTGDYPEVMRQRIDERSAAQGFNVSRLPSFTEEQKQRILGTWDFFGINHYGSAYAYDAERPIEEVSFDSDKGTGGYIDPDWPTSGSDWLYVTPYFFRYLLRWVKDEYNNPPVLITESGMSDRNASLEDGHRIYYFKYYINELLKAIDLDDCNVIGYTAWSLMDNFEWSLGYAEKFGLYFVNFTDPELPRIPKDSALYYASIIADNGFPNTTTPL